MKMSRWWRLKMWLAGVTVLPITPGCVVVITVAPNLGPASIEKIRELFWRMKATVLFVNDGTRIDTVLQPQEPQEAR